MFVRAYLLTKDDRYYKEAMKRILEMIKWEESPNFVGDFNESALLSLCSMAYDAFYDKLDASQKRLLLKEVQKNGTKFFNRFNNHLENHIADNHVWQMVFVSLRWQLSVCMVICRKPKCGLIIVIICGWLVFPD